MLTLIGMCYRYSHRMSVCVPHWLDQGAKVHICIPTIDPDGTRELICDMMEKYPGKIAYQVFYDLDDPFQRAKMFSGALKKVTTDLCGFFDVDVIPPPGLVDLLIKETTNGTATTTKRGNATGDILDKILDGTLKTYDEIYNAAGETRLKLDQIHDRNLFIGYLQVATTKRLIEAHEDSDHIGTDKHDGKVREKLREANVMIKVLETRPLIHLTHPRYIDSNPGVNL